MKALDSSCQCKTCHVQLALQIFPQQEEAVTDGKLLQQPKRRNCGAESGAESGAASLPAKSEPAFLNVLCLIYVTLVSLL